MDFVKLLRLFSDVRRKLFVKFWNVLSLMCRLVSVCEGTRYTRRSVLPELNSRGLTCADMGQGGLQTCFANV